MNRSEWMEMHNEGPADWLPVVWVSDCCGKEMDEDGDLCPRCLEHCEAVAS